MKCYFIENCNKMFYIEMVDCRSISCSSIDPFNFASASCFAIAENKTRIHHANPVLVGGGLICSYILLKLSTATHIKTTITHERGYRRQLIWGFSHGQSCIFSLAHEHGTNVIGVGVVFLVVHIVMPPLVSSRRACACTSP